ncbi:MAG TPA: efflux RND transporter periplasmic adaptor subunit [Steroidobacteraceae bacterium]|nr:efflux RND transporter periplasmic adaptor subunit [Steroidobacteraceae bacterium]
MIARSRGLWVTVALLAGVTLCGCDDHAAMPSAQGFRPEVTVVALKAQPVTLTRELPGRTSAYLVADVRPQVSGIVKRRLFTEGGLVRAGQELYQIDDSIYRAQYDNANAALQKAQANAVAANLAARRAAELIKIDAISAQDNENAISAKAQALADVSAAHAALDSAAVNLAYTRITAPITGRIGRSSVTAGALVTADQSTALATIQQLDPIYVDVNQSSADWLELKQEIDSGRIRSSGAGTPATIVLENGAIYPHRGKLLFTDVTVDPTTGNFLLRVLVPNPEGLLLPGMYVRAVIDEGVLPHGVLAPQGGIEHDPRGNATALVVDSVGRVEQRRVGITRAIGARWLIDSGLSAGDLLIVSGIQKVQPGMPVRAVQEAEPR